MGAVRLTAHFCFVICRSLYSYFTFTIMRGRVRTASEAFLKVAKTAVSKNISSKSKTNGKEAKRSPKTPQRNGSEEFAVVELAIAEYKKRLKSQLESIKKTDNKLLREMLFQMVLGRRFEEKSAEVYRMGKIGGFCHLYIGQEAIAVGSIMALEPSDMVITSYRDHVQAMVKGMTPESVLAELYGKEGGCVKGKGGSMHMFSKEHEFFGGH